MLALVASTASDATFRHLRAPFVDPTMMCRPKVHWLLSPIISLAVFAAHAIEVDAAECREAAQFVGNAAQSRVNGASKDFFVGKLDEDLFWLESIPPEMRWFAHGENEAQFLRSAVLDVFDFPRAPSEHANEFLASCLQSADTPHAPETPPARDTSEARADDRNRI